MLRLKVDLISHEPASLGARVSGVIRLAGRRNDRDELALAHDALGQLTRADLAICLQMAQANVGDLTLPEEAVIEDVLSALLPAALTGPS